jgi:hypothetical protein
MVKRLVASIRDRARVLFRHGWGWVLILLLAASFWIVSHVSELLTVWGVIAAMVVFVAFWNVPMGSRSRATDFTRAVSGTRLYSPFIWILQAAALTFLCVFVFIVDGLDRTVINLLTAGVYLAAMTLVGLVLLHGLKLYGRTVEPWADAPDATRLQAWIARYLKRESLFWVVAVGLLATGLFTAAPIWDAVRVTVIGGGAFSAREAAPRVEIGFLTLFLYTLPFLPALISRRWTRRPISPRLLAVAWFPLFLLADLCLNALLVDPEDAALLGGTFAWDEMIETWGWSFLDETSAPSSDWTKLVNIFGNLGVISVAFWAMATLERGIVTKSETRRRQSALSIHPEARRYVDREGYRARVARLIENSTGGVVGITGVRGAGKSALLGTVQRDFEDKNCVVWTVAPVRHGDATDLSYLMSICRSLCGKAIEDTERVLYGPMGEGQIAFAEFGKKLRLPVLVGAALVSFTWSLGFFDPNLHQASRLLLPAPKVVMVAGEVVWGGRAGLIDAVEDLVAVEESMLTQLARDLDTTIESARSTPEARFAILPNFPGSGLSVVRAAPDAWIQHGELGRFGFDSVAIRPTGQAETLWDYDRVEEQVTDPPLHSRVTSSIPGLDWETVRSAYSFIIGAKEGRYGLVPDPDRFLTLLNLRRAVVNGDLDTGVGLAWSDSAIPFTADVMPQEVLRNYPGFELVLVGHTDRLVRAVGAPAEGLLPADLASNVFLDDYVDVVARFRAASPDGEARREILEDLLLDRDGLVATRAAIDGYLSLLRGESPVVEGDSGFGTTAEFLAFLDRVLELAPSELRLPLVLLLIAVVFILLPEIYRLVNFLLRALMNHRMLILLRESERFLEELSYSDSRSVSGGFGFAGGLSIRGSRSLSARAMTLQSLTDRYQGYVNTLLPYYNGKLILIIDELDKMTDPNDVRNVLLQLKGALFQRGCYYLLSLSEDCAKAFRGRLIEGRDIFESTFEDVLEIKRIEPETAREMVRARLRDDDPNGRGGARIGGGRMGGDRARAKEGRAIALSDAAIDVMTAFSGGIPREIVRMLREAVLTRQAVDTDTRSPGGAITARAVALSVLRDEVLRWRETLTGAPLSGRVVLELRTCCDTALDCLARVDSDSDVGGDGNPFEELDGALSRAVDLIDPRKRWLEEPLVTGAEALQDPARMTEYRVQAEARAALRLRVMTALARGVCEKGTLSTAEVDRAIQAIRDVTAQPVLAERWIEEIETR